MVVTDSEPDGTAITLRSPMPMPSPRIWRRWSPRKSRDQRIRAIELDLNFAAPHAGLALAAISDYVSGWAPDPAQALDEAERWARRAVELSDQEPVSHMALAGVLLWPRTDQEQLRRYFLQGLPDGSRRVSP